MAGIPDGQTGPEAPPTADRPAAARKQPAATPKARPDPRPLRIAFGMGAVATASALITAFAAPGAGTATTHRADDGDRSRSGAAPSVRHVIQYVQLKPGQTAPPKAVVKQAPALPPKVVVVTTRQSGGKK